MSPASIAARNCCMSRLRKAGPDLRRESRGAAYPLFMGTTSAGRGPASFVHRWREPATRAVARLIPGDVLWYVGTADPVFALTFDDGPAPESTPRLLEVLARHQAKATFFLVGERVEAHPHLVEAIIAGGHE